MKHTTPFMHFDYQPNLGMGSLCMQDWCWIYFDDLEPKTAFCKSTETL